MSLSTFEDPRKESDADAERFITRLQSNGGRVTRIAHEAFVPTLEVRRVRAYDKETSFLRRFIAGVYQ